MFIYNLKCTLKLANVNGIFTSDTRRNPSTEAYNTIINIFSCTWNFLYLTEEVVLSMKTYKGKNIIEYSKIESI